MSSDALVVSPPPVFTATHHAAAAHGNALVTEAAERAILRVLRSGRRISDRSVSGPGSAETFPGAPPPPAPAEQVSHVLVKAAAGAGKSFALKRLIAVAAGAPGERKVGVVAFTNNQIRQLALSLAEGIGPERVCLHLSSAVAAKLPDEVRTQVRVSTTAKEIPETADVIVSTASKLNVPSEPARIRAALGLPEDEPQLYSALFVDEAWQLPHHLFDRIGRLAPLVVGVGDVGQLPPLEVGANPWRGDRSHNPYRAWPEAYAGRTTTWERELPTVWRPPAESLPLWRAFYPQWGSLDCVAAPGERSIVVKGEAPSAALWRHIGTGAPTLVEVDGLEPTDAPDLDLPLLQQVETWLDELFMAGFEVRSARYAGDGSPTGEVIVDTPGTRDDGDPLVVILATRNQAVDDAHALSARLRARHNLRDRDVMASTVDSWQGQTNALTIAIHPLNGAAEMDEFNSAFGRLAVACTRHTHGLLLLARGGLDELLTTVEARPGTPFGEPGIRQLPRQTHQRVLGAMSRARVRVR